SGGEPKQRASRSSHRWTRPLSGCNRWATASTALATDSSLGELSAPMTRTRIAVLASGGGTNLQAILDYLAALGERRHGEVVVVATDRAKAGALERAEAHGVAGALLSTPARAAGEDLAEVLRRHRAELIVLAGYLRRI